ncbi:MAG: prepilin-type N-terminal cleavage/methylation domain-containing protein [Phycisphaerales bacterium]|nr:MAG: prepilin-type N-terminal cleavage/methylation domain-containing protein [Phycisphaerales bacterium]
MKSDRSHAAFTLLEMLVVIAIVAILIAVVLPSMSRAKRQSKTTLCSTRLHTFGQGFSIYAYENEDVLPPGRMPKVDDERWQIEVAGGLKYRPTFIAMLGTYMAIPPFRDPQRKKTDVDRDGERGDRQDYADEAYTCPETRTWTDERNGCYGYNYQFLGNARLLDDADPWSFKNWPIRFSRIKSTSNTVAVGDSLGTAAHYPPGERAGYNNNGRTLNEKGNEGFNLDPPIVDPVDGEIASLSGDVIELPSGGTAGLLGGSSGSPKFKPAQGDSAARSAVDLRHGEKTNILWLDGRVSLETLESLGYVIDEDKSVGLGDIDSIDTEEEVGSNRRWTPNQKNRVWLKP